MGELVSIVVPIFKVEEYLDDCIESIINQTYKDIEIILVDDGSPDNCGIICDAYAKKDNRIKVIHKENGGLSDARNFGIRESVGKYLFFVDADDAIHKYCIEMLMNIMVKEKADIVAADYKSFSHYEEVKDEKIDDNIVNKSRVLAERDLYDENFLKTTTMQLTVAWGKIYKKELWNGIWYPKGKIHEDTFTTYKLMDKAAKVVYVKEKLYYWRENLNSIMRASFSLNHLQGIDAYIEQLEYFHNAKKQRHVEIVFSDYVQDIFWCYNRMKEKSIDFSPLTPYLEYMRKHLSYVKLSKSLGLKQWVRYRYLAYYKIPKLLANKGK